MPPQVNATLRTVSARASTDDFHDPSGPDTVLFDGARAAWYSETRRRVSGIGQDGAAASDVLIDRTLAVDPLPITITEGQVIVFTTHRGDTITGVVQAVEAPDHPHVPDSLKPVRITLEVA
jgi:hypothetical protein